ncbi:unnamed protein product [Nippostrongylus brasiliensis]|uniref:Ovule protein n=1 Tax=Nippostrongylus brasiliensis TaxID=27835 RepID=A0A0N4YVD1_NIPBR|nr:unnamed protein product [Nippostrongylus brasiliensis]
MLDSLGGKQISPWFDSLSSTMNSNSSVSSGSPPNFSQFGNSELQRPSWLFNSQVRDDHPRLFLYLDFLFI